MKFITLSSQNIDWNLRLSTVESFSEPKCNPKGIWHISFYLKGKDNALDFIAVDKESAVAQYAALLAAFGMTA
jgi:hypothetical protein